MTLTIEVPDETAARLTNLPAETVNRYAVAALEDLALNADAIAADEADCIANVEAALADIDANGLKNTISLEDARLLWAEEKAARHRAKSLPLEKAA